MFSKLLLRSLYLVPPLEYRLFALDELCHVFPVYVCFGWSLVCYYKEDLQKRTWKLSSEENATIAANKKSEEQKGSVIL